MHGWRTGILMVMLLATAPALAQQGITVTAMAPSGGSLRSNQDLNVRVHYVSTQPVRIQARDLFEGKAVPGITNASPVWPAGEGDVLAWISYRNDAVIDAVVVGLYDVQWHPLDEVKVPAAVDWSANAPRRPDADWVAPLAKAATARLNADAKAASDATNLDPVGVAITTAIFMAPLVYLLLQILLPVLWRGGWRKAALVPLVAMLPALGVSLLALAGQSNLWPIWLVLLAPVAALYLLLLVVLRVVAARRAVKA